MLLAITACVLAIAVPIVGVLVSLMYVRSVLLQAEAKQSERFSVMQATWTTSCAQLSERVKSCETGLQMTSGTHLQAELAALAGDVDALSKTVRKNFGRVWAELHHDGMLKRNNHSQREIEEPALDDELAATLALQRANPASP
jgi:hypothetical protein